METEYKIKGVIFARNWYAAVRPGLLPSDRLQFYDAVFEYAFEGSVLQGMSPAVQIAFDMVKPFIEQDIVKYRERCERNRQNARGGKRVAASGSESLPVATNTNTSTNTSTNNNTNTISMSEEKEKFFICALFYSRGSISPGMELNKFWQYYESLGWRNNKGAPITKKMAAAKMWDLQSGVTKMALAPRAAWSNAMLQCDSCDIRVFDNLVRTEIQGEVLHLYARDVKEFAALMENSFIAGLKRYAASYSCSRVLYHPAE